MAIVKSPGSREKSRRASFSTLIVCLLALVVIVSFTACGESQKDGGLRNPASEGKEQDREDNQPPYVMEQMRHRGPEKKADQDAVGEALAYENSSALVDEQVAAQSQAEKRELERGADQALNLGGENARVESDLGPGSDRRSADLASKLKSLDSSMPVDEVFKDGAFGANRALELQKPTYRPEGPPAARTVPIPDPEPAALRLTEELTDPSSMSLDLLEAEFADVDLPATDDIVFGIPDSPPPVPSAPSPIVGGRASGAGAAMAKQKRQIGDAVGRASQRRVARQNAAKEEAQLFLERIQDLENLSLQSATGYWSNSYVPGDARLRFLAEQLRDVEPAPHELARRPWHSVDAPRRAALGVALDADRRSQDGPGRMLLRVGLRATERFAGRRPAMNLAVVLDLRSAQSSADEARIRALLSAFVEHQEVGDRFRLFLAGSGGGLVLDAEEFRHGPLQDFFQRRASGESSADEWVAWDRAYLRGIEAVAGADDPEAPLGSSAVVVIATAALGDQLTAIEAAAHRSAVAGIQTTTIGLAAAETHELRRLALAGQGRLHHLTEASEASALVDMELQSTARAVARAVRLRIRLAPGVELVDVLGSRRLDVARAEQVREAEKAVDRRLARNLGLAADRGEDDEGIQIVIPAFYAGDVHTVLLDVVAPGAGQIADVRVKFKDLVHLENGVVRAHLNLDRGAIEPGAIERSVLASRLAYEVELALADAAKSLDSGQVEAALERIRRLDLLLAGMPRAVPDLENHRGLELDRRMLELFLDVLKGSQSQAQWAAALRYAGLRKRLPAPEAF